MTREDIANYMLDHASNINEDDAKRFAGIILRKLDFSPMWDQVNEIIMDESPGLGFAQGDTPPWGGVERAPRGDDFGRRKCGLD